MSSVDPQAVLQTLSAAAAGQSVAEQASDICQKTFGRPDASSSSKLLASSLVHSSALHDSDWTTVTQSIKEGLSSADVDAQVLSLQLCPSLPAQYMTQLVIQDDLGDFVVACLIDGEPDVRTSALGALGHILVQPSIVRAVCEHPGKAVVFAEYCYQICEHLVDLDDQTSGSAFRAVKMVLESKEGLEGSEQTTPSAVLIHRWWKRCCSAIESSLPAILHRISSLDASNLIPALDVVFAIGMAALKGHTATEDQQKLTLWTAPVFGRLLERFLSSSDIAVVHRSAKYLLQLCEECTGNESEAWAVMTSSSIASWSIHATSALENLLDSKESVPARGDILLTITKHLKLLEPGHLGSVVRRLLQNIGFLPRSFDRTRSLMHLWSAVFASDLKLRKLRQSRGDGAPGTSLRSFLEDPFFAGVVTGQQRPGTELSLQRLISRASYPAYKQELVSTLMEVIGEVGQGFEIESVFPKHDAGSEEQSLQSAIQGDMQSDVVDWFASSVEALFLTQACLGWDNTVVDGHYGLTLPADLWLQQLQSTTHALYTILAHYDIHFLVELGSVEDDVAAKSRTGKILKKIASEVFEIQKLMKRMVFFWSFLNTALKPRVFWVVSHHIELPDRLDDVWNYLIDCLKDLLQTRPLEVTKRQQSERIEAGRQGKLAPGNSSVYNTKQMEQTKSQPIAFSQSEVCHEGMTAGLACLAQLAEILIEQYNYEGFSQYYSHVGAIGEKLKITCTQILEDDYLTVNMFDQCKAVIKQLDFVISNPPSGAVTIDDTDRRTEGSGQETEAQKTTHLPQDLRNKYLEGYPFMTATGITANKQCRRHKSLRWSLLNSMEEARKDRGGHRAPVAAPVPERPTPVELAAAVGGLNLNEDDRGWTRLTGQGDPIQLSIRHQVDTFRRTLEIEMSAENRMESSEITGVVISLAIEGPVEADREGLIVWHLETLQADTASTHRFELGLSNFGPIEIQPFMDVALHGSEAEMSALSCSFYHIPLIDLLLLVSVHPSVKVYVQEVASWPEVLNTTAVCRWPGTRGAMQLLSALKQSPMRKIWPKDMHSLGIFQAVYIMQTFDGALVSFALTGQLVDLQRMGLAAWTVPPDSTSSGNQGYYLCKCTFTSRSADAIASIRAQTAELLTDLSDGGLALGLDPGVGRPPPPPPIDPEIFIDLGLGDRSLAFIPDLPSLALEEWKRLNRGHGSH